MGKFCCIFHCGNRSDRDKGISFHKIPKIISHQGEQTAKLSKERLDKWLANIRRDAVQNGEVTQAYVCSIHFHQGKPSGLYEQSHPDWAPSKQMGHSSCSVSRSGTAAAMNRHNRVVERSAKRRKCLEELFLQADRSEKEDINPNDNVKPLPQVDQHELESESDSEFETEVIKNCNPIQTQTELTLLDIEELEETKLKCSSNELLTKAGFQDDDEKVRFYTGLTTMSVLMAIFELVSPGLPQRESLSKFQQLLLTLMRLRLNLCVQDLGYRFGVHASTVSRVFQTCVQTMYTSMSFLVRWPGREDLRLTLPLSFKDKYSSCAVIIDCFEVFIDRPSCLLARAQTWSSYKHHNTAKFLIGITPQGTVSFISKSWGGRVSDKFITENCGMLSNLLPGDLVLADRGFDIHDSCGLYSAHLKIPSFTKGKPQLSTLDVETTRALANVRIHVERVIGCVRQKYVILGHGIAPIHYVMSDNEEPCLLDKIAFVCCALTNCCKSVVSTE